VLLDPQGLAAHLFSLEQPLLPALEGEHP